MEEALGSGAPAASVLAHLETCSTCQAAASGIREDNEFIDGLGRAERTQLATAFDAGMQNATVAHDRLPGYDVLGEIHRGGQGVIYKAVQHGTQRTVAIKVMHEGPFAGPRDKARFEREVRLLAQLDHPNIVTILESGTAAGSFFHVMDYVAGRSLADHIEAETVPVNQALALFAEICDGVNAAHVLHITHRDLKPANIQIDNAGRPRILDFGLAKHDLAAGGDGAPSQHITATGQFVGTFPWAAPEQAEGAPEKIDARTDVYALGVTLYQLLTRRFPYDVTGQPREVLDNILTAQPDRPSKHRRDINDEVETIVLKCLAKDPDRRYQSAGDLARDIRHYLTGEPIEAKRDSTLYVLGKTLRRYKLAAAVAAGFLLLITASAVALSFLYFEANTQTGIAKIEKGRADEVAETRRRDLYAAHMNLAKRYWDEGNVSRVLELLESHRPLGAQKDLRGWEWYYLWRISHGSLLTLRGHAAVVQAVAWSPDGLRLASGSNDKTVKLWSVGTGEVTATLRGHSRTVNSVAWSPDGQRIASTGFDKTVKIWDATTGRELLTFRGHDDLLFTVAWSPDGRRVASASWSDRMIKVWDPATGKEHLSVRTDEKLWELTWSPDGRHLAGGENLTGTIRVWNSTTGSELIAFDAHSPHGALAVAWSPNGERLASGGHTHSVKIWDTADWREVVTFRGHVGWVVSVAWSPDSRRVASGSRDTTVRIWDVGRGQEALVFRGHTDAVTGVSWRPNGLHVASASVDGTIRLWDATVEPEAITLRGHGGPVKEVAWNPDGKQVAMASHDHTVKVWDARTGQLVRTLRGHTDRVIVLAWRPNRTTMASGSRDGTIKTWDPSTGRVIRTWVANKRGVPTLAWNPDGRRLASGSGEFDGAVKIWDAAAGQQLMAVGGVRAVVTWLEWSPDGERLAWTSPYARMVKVRNHTTGQDVPSVPLRDVATEMDSEPESVTWSPDGTRLLVGLGGGSFQVLDAVAGAEVLRGRGHTSRVLAAWSPNGRRLATCGADSLIKIWDAVTGQELLTLRGHTAAVSEVAWSPDGRQLASSSADGTAKIWTAATPHEVDAHPDPPDPAQPPPNLAQSHAHN